MIPSFLQAMPIIGILRGIAREPSVSAASVAARCGITTLEVTMNSEEPGELLKAIRSALPDATIGAGTVMNMRDVQIALSAGAQFIVSPHLDERIVEYCATRDIPVFPGAMTPTEVWRAHSAGATMVKLFPAVTLGPEYIRQLRGPLPQIDLMVTGGVDAGNLRSFLDAGARAVGVGGNLFPREALQRGDVSVVEREASRLLAAVMARHS